MADLIEGVLHDWDRPNVSGAWAIRRGITLIVYGVSKFFRHPLTGVVSETDSYAATLLKLDKLLGVKPVFGVTDGVRAVKGGAVSGLICAGADVRRHTHVGGNDDPNRVRTWEPPLTQGRATWHYEEDWIAGGAPKLQPGERPIWHVDNPHHLRDYIDYLYEASKR